MDLHKEKQRLRRYYLQLRSNRSSWQYYQRDLYLQRRITDYLLGLGKYHVLGYLPFRGEPDAGLIDFCKAYRCSLWLPIVDSTKPDMKFAKYESKQNLKKNCFGILEPASGAEEFDESLVKDAVVVMPAVAIDKEGYRLGYGGGFYDRFLSRVPSLTRVAVVDSHMIAEHIPRDSLDMRAHVIITELNELVCF